jgi:hypothetical protein
MACAFTLLGCSSGDDSATPLPVDGGTPLDGTTAADVSAGDTSLPATDAGGDSTASGDSSPGSDASVADVNIPDVAYYDGADGGACNNLVNGAPSAPVTNVAGSLPVGTGGTVLAGTYFLSGAKVYMGDAGIPDAGGQTARETLALDPTGTNTFNVAVALETGNGTPMSGNQSIVFNPSGTATITTTCGNLGGANGPTTYTFDSASTPKRFHAYVTNAGGGGQNEELVFDLQ